MPKFEVINKKTMPKVREALGNYLAIKSDLSREAWLLGSDIVVYLSKEVEKGAIYNIPTLKENQNLHLENVNLILDLDKNQDRLDVLTFYALIVKTVAEILNNPNFYIESVTPSFLSKYFSKYRIA